MVHESCAIAILHNNIPLCAHSLFQNMKGDARIYWVPGHAGLQGNEGVNQLARDTALRAPCNRSQPQEPTPPKPITLQDLRDHPNPYVRPHPQLSKHEQVLFRQAQMGTLLTPARVALYNGTPTPTCPKCSKALNQDHIFDGCNPFPEGRAALQSPALNDQRRLADFVKKFVRGALN